MTQAEEIVQRRRAIRWAEDFYDRCAAIHCSINGDRALAQALCELGRRVASGEVSLGDRTRRDFVDIALAHISGELRPGSSKTPESQTGLLTIRGDLDCGTSASEFLREVKTRKPLPRLSPRQREVLQLLAMGRTMNEVAAALGITPRTVGFHKYSVMTSLGLKTNTDLIRFAIKHKIISA